MSSSSLQFQNLPLAQVAVKVAFTGLASLTGPICHDFLSTVSERFPEPQAVFQAPETFGVPKIAIENPFMLEAVGASKRDTTVLACMTMQVFGILWVAPGKPSIRDYPGFDSLFEDLDWLASRLEQKMPGSEFAAAQVTYQNFVSNDSSAGDPGWFLCDEILALPQLLAGAKIESFDLNFTKGAVLEGLRLRVRTATHPEVGEGYSLETICGSMVGPGRDWRSTMEVCHANLQSAFPSILSKEAKAKWQLITSTP